MKNKLPPCLPPILILGLCLLLLPAAQAQRMPQDSWYLKKTTDIGVPVSAIARDEEGNIYISDPEGGTIKKYTSSYELLATWGGWGSGDGQFGQQSSATSSRPRFSVVEDAISDISPDLHTGGGTLDIVKMETTETENDIIFTLTVNGNITSADWGCFMIGIANQALPGTTDGNAWGRPISLNAGNGRGMTHWIGSWVNGGGGSQFFSYDGAGWNQLESPGLSTTAGEQSTITYSVSKALLGLSDGDAIVFDAYSSGSGGSDSAVDALSKSSITVSNWGATYRSEAPNISSLGSVGGPQDAGPQGLCFDAGQNLVVCDPVNHRVQVFSRSGEFLFKFGIEGSGSGQFSSPVAAAVSPDNKIYVADRDNHRVQVFDAAGNFVSQFGEEGSFDGQLIRPTGLALLPNGNVAVADSGNRRIQIFSPDGEYDRKLTGRSVEGLSAWRNGTMLASAGGKINAIAADDSWTKELVSASGAGLIPNGDFSNGSENWLQVSGGGEGPATTFATGGNPGGYGTITPVGGWGILVSPTDPGASGGGIPIASLGLTAGSPVTFTYDSINLSGAGPVGGFVWEAWRDNQLIGRTGEVFPTPIGDGSSWETYTYNWTLPPDTDKIVFVPLWARGSDGSTIGVDNVGVVPNGVALAEAPRASCALALPNGDALFATESGAIHHYVRTFRTILPEAANAVPMPVVLSTAQRPGSGLVDVDYRVDDADNAAVTTAAVAFRNGGVSLGDVIPIRTLAEGTETNLGAGMATGRSHRFTWDARADLTGDFEQVRVEVLVRDGRDLFNLDFIQIPEGSGQPSLKISKTPLKDLDFFSAMLWLIASGDPEINFADGKVTRVSDGSDLGLGANSAGVDFLLARMGLREATPAEILRAKEAGTPGVINRWDPPLQVGPGERPVKVNAYGFETADTGIWVVPTTP